MPANELASGMHVDQRMSSLLPLLGRIAAYGPLERNAIGVKRGRARHEFYKRSCSPSAVEGFEQAQIVEDGQAGLGRVARGLGADGVAAIIDR